MKMSNKGKEEILKECTEGLLKCSVTYNMSHKGILQAMEEYKNQELESLQNLVVQEMSCMEGINCNHPYEYLSFGEDSYCSCDKCKTRLC